MTQTQVVSTEPQHIRISDIAAKHGPPPWSEWLFTDGRNNVGLICDAPGMANDAHIHKDFNEWWIVFQGEIIWEIGDYPPIRARAGDVVVCPRRLRHSIKTVGAEPSLRLYINAPWSNHEVRGERSSILQPFPNITEPPNMLLNSRAALLERLGEPSWTTALVDDERNKANLIAHGQGMTNNAHWHPDFNEWWTILQGDLTFRVGEDRPLIEATQGDIVFVPEGMRHFITSVGKGTSLRLAVTNSENQHIYTEDDDSAPPPIS